MRVLVLGAGGMAGHVAALHLRSVGHDVETLSATLPLDADTRLVDVRDQRALDRVLSAGEYDVVVNCIGVLVKQSEQRKDLAAYLNGYLPQHLAQELSTTSTKLIHISTDCVFSGSSAPYTETSPYDGELFYDRSKALGEVINDKDLTFRMSIVGPELRSDGSGLFNWFFHQTGPVTGYTNAIWSGITTIELARGIEAAIGQQLTGLYHLVPNRNISKFALLELFRAVFDRSDITMVPAETAAVDKTLLNTRSDFDFEVGSYEQMVNEMQAWINEHRDRYPHYGGTR
jgi:dTDP-4-dehydrorhamnose reductase